MDQSKPRPLSWYTPAAYEKRRKNRQKRNRSLRAHQRAMENDPLLRLIEREADAFNYCNCCNDECVCLHKKKDCCEEICCAVAYAELLELRRWYAETQQADKAAAPAPD